MRDKKRIYGAFYKLICRKREWWHEEKNSQLFRRVLQTKITYDFSPVMS